MLPVPIPLLANMLYSSWRTTGRSFTWSFYHRFCFSPKRSTAYVTVGAELFSVQFSSHFISVYPIEGSLALTPYGFVWASWILIGAVNGKFCKDMVVILLKRNRFEELSHEQLPYRKAFPWLFLVSSQDLKVVQYKFAQHSIRTVHK